MDTTDHTITEEQLKKEQPLYDNTPRYTKMPEDGEGFSKTGMLKELVGQLTTGVDMWRVSLPASLLTPLSFLEYICIVVQPQKYILSAHKQMEPEQRFLSVTRWWMDNVSLAVNTGICHSKPFNPILGEKFVAKYEHGDSDSYFVAEQVSHHPPVTAVYLVNHKCNFTLRCTLFPTTKFFGNGVSMLMTGSIQLFFHNHPDEIYTIKLPQINGYGLLWGSQRIELNDKMEISCEKTGFSAEINYKSKNNNKLKGKIYKGSTKLYSLKGVSNEKTSIKSATTGVAVQFLDSTIRKPNNDIMTRPVAEQDENESRRVWHGVTRALLRKPRDYNEANRVKKYVEEVQRAVRREREEKKEVWEPVFFKPVSDSTPHAPKYTPSKKKKQVLTLYQFVHEDLSTEGTQNDLFAKYC